MPLIDIKGERYGRLIVANRVQNNKYGDAMWECICDCGNRVTTSGSRIRSGKTRSCGCYHKDQSADLKRTHNGTDTPLYTTWKCMKQRCNNIDNPSYPRYGGRGIRIYADWMEFENFRNWAISSGYKEGLTIERMNNDGDYTPFNCTFVSRAVQNRNTSRVNKVFDNDVILTTAEIARIVGISRSTAAKWYRKEGLRTLDEFVMR